MTEGVQIPPARLVGDEADQLARLLGPARTAWDTSPALVAVTWGPAHRLVYQNATSTRLVGAFGHRARNQRRGAVVLSGGQDAGQPLLVDADHREHHC